MAEDGKLTAEEEDEVSRIVSMYTKRANDKKKKKRKRSHNQKIEPAASASKLSSTCEAESSSCSGTDSSSELNDSDLMSSDSEKRTS